MSKSQFEITESTMNGTHTPSSVGFGTHHHPHRMVEFDEYFVGPRDLDAHSKLPYFLRMHGSVLPRMIVPLLLIGGWATAITCISKFVFQLGVSQVVLTVLGFVVGLALSFRSTTAYERYSDGRKSWATLSVQSRNLARYFWVHIDERPDDLGKEDLLAKLTAINLIQAFAVALKHKLRFEPYTHYADISPLVSHLDTFARAAYDPALLIEKKKTPWKAAGEYLGVSFAKSNPRKTLKRATKPLGNLPLEILTFLSAYVEESVSNGTLKSPIVSGQILTSLSALTDTMAGAERVLTTPLPEGYNILISQIVLIYVYLLPFQLYQSLGWITIPGTVAAAYIIIGLAAIGNELENPFGNDVNDLPLDHYCEELGRELDIMTSSRVPKFSEMVRASQAENKVLWPLSSSGYCDWKERPVNDIRAALKAKVSATAGLNHAPTGAGGVKKEAGHCA